MSSTPFAGAALVDQALLESEQHFRAIFEQAAVGIGLAAPDGRWLRVNQRLCEIVGYAHDELTRLTIQAITHPDDLANALDPSRWLLAGEIHTYTSEQRFLNKDGASVWINLAVSLVRDASGELKHCVAIVEDISTRKAAEDALRVSEARYRTLVDVVPQIIWVLEPDGTIAFFNRRWYDFTGLSPDGALDLGWIEAVHPDDRERVRAARNEGIARRAEYEVEVRLRQHTREYCWHLARVAPLLDASGDIIAWHGAAVEIDERKRAEETLSFMAEASVALASSLDYEATLGAVAELAVPRVADYCLVDLLVEDGRIQRVATVHRDPAKAETMRAVRRFAPLPSPGSPLGNVFLTGQPEFAPEVTEEWLRRAAISPEHLEQIRSLEPVSVIVAPMRTRDQLLGVISLVRIVGSPRFGSSDLMLAEELARRAARAIDNARLHRKAQEAVREREAILSIASHELKNPLTSLMSFAQLLHQRTEQSGALQGRDQRALEIIVEQAERLGTMIDALLDLGRISSGQTLVETRPVDLNALTRDLIEQFLPTLERHTLDLQAPEEALIVAGDPTRLEQVIRNLLGNAIKYSPAGGPIQVELRRDGERACLVVADRGLGIPAGALPNLFGRFYRVPTATRHAKGLGIGLYIVREIVKEHGGTIDVQSVEGEGSTFTVCLPARTEG